MEPSTFGMGKLLVTVLTWQKVMEKALPEIARGWIDGSWWAYDGDVGLRGLLEHYRRQLHNRRGFEPKDFLQRCQ